MKNIYFDPLTTLISHLQCSCNLLIQAALSTERRECMIFSAYLKKKQKKNKIFTLVTTLN